MLKIYQMPGYLARRFHQVSVALFSDEIHKIGLNITPVQYGALVAMQANPGLDQATLAQHISYDRVTIGGVIDRLVQKGFVRREVSSTDRRARELYLTETGDQILAQANPAVENLQETLLSGLNPAEKEMFILLLKKTTDHLEKNQ